MARRLLAEDDRTEINLASMIDCIFILLIFFIVTTVFVEETGLQASKPDSAASVSLEDQKSFTLEITAANRILAGDAEIGIAEVTERVRSGLVDAETPVVIRAHEKARHGVFVAVWDAARRGGAEKLSFATVD